MIKVKGILKAKILNLIIAKIIKKKNISKIKDIH